MKTKPFKTWGRRKGSNDSFITCEVTARNKKEARQKFEEWGIELQDKKHIYC
jgi:hypothetical protein